MYRDGRMRNCGVRMLGVFVTFQRPGRAGSIAVAVVLATTTSQSGWRRTSRTTLSVTLERTSCYGVCPVYWVPRRRWQHHVRRKEVRSGRRAADGPYSGFPRGQAARYRRRVGFFGLRDRYRTIRNPDGTETMVTDLPTTFVTIKRGGQTKRVEDYIGAPRD